MHLTKSESHDNVRRSLLIGGTATAGIVVSSFFSASADAATVVTYSYGMSGTGVKALQDALSVRGLPCGRFGSDSKFGAATRAAVIEYQKLWGLVVDGVAGPKTQSSMAAHPKPHPRIIARLSSRWDESGTIFIIDKMGRRGSPLVSNVARGYLFREGRLLRSIQMRTGGKVWNKEDATWEFKNTPTGSFWVQSKDAYAYSKRYGVEMPYAVFFSGNYGIHYSESFRTYNYGPGNLGSNGCAGIGNKPDSILVFNALTVGRFQVLVQQTSTGSII